MAKVVTEAGAGLAVLPDDPDAFVAAVEQLAEDSSTRLSIGESGRSWISQRRSPAAVAGAFAALAEDLGAR